MSPRLQQKVSANTFVRSLVSTKAGMGDVCIMLYCLKSVAPKLLKVAHRFQLNLVVFLFLLDVTLGKRFVCLTTLGKPGTGVHMQQLCMWTPGGAKLCGLGFGEGQGSCHGACVLFLNKNRY